MVYREGFDRLIRSRKFWLAMLAVAQTVLFQFVPQFPQAVWISINAVLGILIASITVNDVVEANQFIDSGEDESLEG